MGDAQATALLEARLTGENEKDVRLAAVLAIGQVSVPGDAQTFALLGARPTNTARKRSIWPQSCHRASVVKGDEQTIALRRPGSLATAGKMSVWPRPLPSDRWPRRMTRGQSSCCTPASALEV